MQVMDNFDVEEDENMYDLIEGPYKIIFTTRYEHSDYATLLIEKIKGIPIKFETENLNNIVGFILIMLLAV